MKCSVTQCVSRPGQTQQTHYSSFVLITTELGCLDTSLIAFLSGPTMKHTCRQTHKHTQTHTDTPAHTLGCRVRVVIAGVLVPVHGLRKPSQHKLL